MSELSRSARPHLSIGEVLSLLQDEFPDITISKIRFLESQGLLDPERTPSGYRKFYEPDIERLRWILAQQRDHFLPLKVIKDRLEDGTLVEPEHAAGHPPEDEPAAAPAPPAGVDPDRAALAEALARRAAERAAATPPVPQPVAAGELDDGSDPSYTRAELAVATGLAERDVETLESYGLLAGRPLGRETVYDADALAVARLAAAFQAHGLEPRHLRMFKVAAEREAALYEQLVTPLVRQRNAESRRRAQDRLDELAGLGHELRSALLRPIVRGIRG